MPDDQDGAERARLAAEALADAKADAQARGERAPAAEFAAERKVRGDPAAPARRQPGTGGPGGAREASRTGGTAGDGAAVRHP